MLYTMELWWAGVELHPWRQFAYLTACLVLLLFYNRVVGLRSDQGWWGVFLDSVEALGLGLVVSHGILTILEPFEPGEIPDAQLGKTVMEAGMVAIGISVGKAQFGACDKSEAGVEGDDERGWFDQLIFAVCGAVLMAASVGPTDEVMMLSDIAPWRILAVGLLSLLLSMVILYFSNFDEAPEGGGFNVISGTILSYGVALVCSAVLLYFFGRLDNQSVAQSLNQIVALGLPASLGSSAGRLLLQVQ